MASAKIQFEILYAELEDLAPDDPMRPAAIVHVLGDDVECYHDAIRKEYPIYVIGWRNVPGGYFLVASRPDYPT